MILHHLTGPRDSLGPLALSLPDPLYHLVRGGYLAVTTFFVLSGFVLTRSYAKTDWTGGALMRYGIGRMARIYPVYLLSILAVAPFIFADRTPGKAGFVAAYVGLAQGWLGTIPVNWNTPSWSLSCEAFFYLAFPLAAIFFRRATWTTTLTAAAGTTCLTRVLWAAGVSDGVKPVVHLADFIMGIAAACAYDLLQRRPRRLAGTWLYLPGCLLGAILIAFPQLLPGGLDLNSALRPLNAALLIGFALGGGALARALSTRTAVYLGKSSYSMYILHVPILWWYHRWSGSFSPWLYLAAVIAISAGVYGLFEEPANRWVRGLVKRAR